MANPFHCMQNNNLLMYHHVADSGKEIIKVGKAKCFHITSTQLIIWFSSPGIYSILPE